MGIFNPDTKRFVLQQIEELEAQGVQGVILGCTALRLKVGLTALSRGPNAGSICDRSIGNDTDPRRNRTPSVRDVDNSGSYGISTPASIRRHPSRMSCEHSDDRTHRSVHKCARRRLLDKESQRPGKAQWRAAWLWKLETCPISLCQPTRRLAYQLSKKFTPLSNGSRLFVRAVTAGNQ